jgi:hypothetical protein
VTAVDEQLEAIKHLDFRVPCFRTACDRDADWYVICRMCEHTFARCEQHLAKERAIVAANPRWGVGCMKCRAVDVGFDELFNVVTTHRTALS